MGLVAPWHVGSSCTRALTRVPALAGGFLTTEPSGKPEPHVFLIPDVVTLRCTTQIPTFKEGGRGASSCQLLQGQPQLQRAALIKVNSLGLPWWRSG